MAGSKLLPSDRFAAPKRSGPRVGLGRRGEKGSVARAGLSAALADPLACNCRTQNSFPLEPERGSRRINAPSGKMKETQLRNTQSNEDPSGVTRSLGGGG